MRKALVAVIYLPLSIALVCPNTPSASMDLRGSGRASGVFGNSGGFASFGNSGSVGNAVSSGGLSNVVRFGNSGGLDINFESSGTSSGFDVSGRFGGISGGSTLGNNKANNGLVVISGPPMIQANPAGLMCQKSNGCPATGRVKRNRRYSPNHNRVQF
ncbi:MAG: hypothetical protein WA733_21765 [Methylocystis sp.]|jgi:hypothetical protein